MVTVANIANEAQLMRTCGHLYVSISMESFATTCMAMIFSYLLLLITNKGRLKNPGKAFHTFVRSNWNNFYADLCEEVSHWKEMPQLDLQKRFGMCRKVNQAVCMFQILIAFLTVERWLHINNVNGFRYLGYSMTCPPMQAQLIVLIAPVVPCYKLHVVTTYVLTCVMLLCGYAASVIPGDLWEGDMMGFVDTWDLEVLKPNFKFWFTVGACCVLSYLTFLQLPWLAAMYYIHGGPKANLPRGYPKLLLIVGITWLAFPCWWALSFEGLSIITDTKMNAAGFAILNVISKGGFTLHMLSMVKRYRRDKQREECLQSGARLSKAGKVGLFDPAEKEQPAEVNRAPKRQETWVVSMLRRYDDEDDSPQEWQTLDATYRAYLVGHNVTPSSWKSMDQEHRLAMHEAYQNSMDLVMGEDAGKIQGMAAAPPPPVESAPPQGFAMQPLKAKAQPPMHHHHQFEESKCATPMSIRAGQTVTTVHGVRGRVLKVQGTELQLALQGKRTQIVRKEDVTVLKVMFLGARGLREADRTGRMLYSCSCMVDARPNSEVMTPAKASPGSRATWEHEVEVLGYGVGDGLAFRLYGTDQQSGEELQLGEAALTSAELCDHGFEGELQLVSEDGCSMNTFLKVTIIAVNMPEYDEDAREENYQM